MKLNLGCGVNKLQGFVNLDANVGWTFERGEYPHYDVVEAITISHALMYVDEKDIKRVMYELYKCLRFFGTIRITEDDTEDPASERKDGYEGHKIKTGPKMMRKLLREAGFTVFDVDQHVTTYKDKSLIQNFHGVPPKVFHIEGIKTMMFKDLQLAHDLLDNLHGIEIGASAHNPFHLPHCKNVDYTDDMNTVFKKAEVVNCGEAAKVDVIANGDQLPFDNESQDYVIASHVFEHFFDPISVLQEWLRVVKPGGFVFMILPHAKRVPDEKRPANTIDELIARHDGTFKKEDVNWEGAHGGKSDGGHWTVWDLPLFIKLANHLNLDIFATEDPDQKVGNGFTVVIKKKTL